MCREKQQKNKTNKTKHPYKVYTNPIHPCSVVTKIFNLAQSYFTTASSSSDDAILSLYCLFIVPWLFLECPFLASLLSFLPLTKPLIFWNTPYPSSCFQSQVSNTPLCIVSIVTNHQCTLLLRTSDMSQTFLFLFLSSITIIYSPVSVSVKDYKTFNPFNPIS